MTVDLIELLTEAMDETERIALAANPSPWRWRIPGAGHLDQNTIFGDGEPRGMDKLRQVCSVEAAWEREANAAHIIHNNPKHVLDKVAADREILELYTGTVAIKDAVEEKKRLGDEPTRQEWNDWARCQHELAALRVVVESLAKGYGIDTSGSAKIAAIVEREGLPY